MNETETKEQSVQAAHAAHDEQNGTCCQSKKRAYEQFTREATAGAGAAPEEKIDLQEALNACIQEQNEWRDKYVRLTADLYNYQQRVKKDQAMWTELAQVKLLTGIIDVMDNFDRALEQKAQLAIGDNLKSWVDGITMVHASLQKFIADTGVQEIADCATFDPEKHEAIMQVNSSEHASGDIVAVLQKGYVFKDRVVRPAKVSVAQ